MNILYINHYAGSPTYGMEYRPYYLAREWIKKGHKVTIIASSFSHIRSTNPIIVGKIQGEVIDGIKYIWIKTPEYSGNGIKRVINIFSFASKLVKNCKKFTRIIDPDIVITSSTYPLDIYPAYRIAKFANAKLIFEVHDLWPLTPMEIGGMSKWHPFIIIMQKAEDFAYKIADKVVSILPKALDYMVTRGLDPKKFIYIPNGVDIDEWNDYNCALPLEHQEVFENLKMEDKFIVGYAGSHGLANALDYFVESAVYLKDLPVSFILVGQGPVKENLKEYVKKHNLDNVVFLPSVPKNSIPKLLSKMDVLYIGWRKSPLYRFGISPNKLFDYMMAGKPVIHAVDAGNDLVAESHCGISIPPEDAISIAEAIKKLFLMSPAERDEIGQRGREYVVKNHDYKVLAERFLEIFND